MNQIEIRQQVLDLLQRFKGTEPLKELFWSHLNYDRVKNQTITIRKWPEPVASVLAEDPTLCELSVSVRSYQEQAGVPVILQLL